MSDEPAGAPAPVSGWAADATLVGTLARTVDAACFRLDGEGRLRAVTEELLELTGRSRDGLLDEHVSVLFEPADAARAEIGLRRLATGDEAVESVAVAVTDGAEETPCTLRLGRGDDGIVGVLRPREEGGGGHREFEEIVDAVADYAIFTLETDGTVVSWNTGAERIKGYAAEEIIGERFDAFYTAEDRAAGVPSRNLAKAVEHGRVEDEGWRVRADGSRFWANVVITAVRDDDGDLDGFVKVTRDMTGRRARARELRRERDLVERVLDAAPVGISVVEPDGEVVRTNVPATDGDVAVPNVTEYDAYTPDGEPLSPADRPSREVFETGEPVYDRELRVDLPDDGERFLSVTAVPLTDDEGIVDRAVVSVDDVTRLKAQARQVQRERDVAESELAEVFERVTDAFYAIDRDWRFTHVNDRAAELLDRSAEELIGANLRNELPEIVGTEFEESYERAVETQEPVSFEAYYEPLSVWFAVDAYPSETGLSVYFRDVTERKERERELEQYRTITEAARDVIVTIDTDSTIRSTNPAIESVFGYEPDELVGEPLTKLMPDRYTERHEAGLRRYLETGEQHLDWDYVELPGQHRDGHEMELAISFGETQYRNERYFTGIVRDITERKERERELAQSRRRYRTLVEEFPNGVVALFDEEMRYLVAGGEGFEMYPFEPDEVEGEPLDESLPPELVDQIRPHYEAVLDGEERSFEVSFGERTLQFHAIPIRDQSGRVTAGMGMSQDVTDQRRRQQALETQVRQQAVVTELGQRALAADDLDALFSATVRIVAETLDNDYCKVLDLDADGDDLSLRAGVGWREGIVGEASVGVDRDSQVGYTLLSEEPVVVEDLRTEERFSGPALLTSHDVRSGISVVIGPPDDPWGVLGTHDSERTEFTQQDANFVQAVANILATAIERTEHERALRHQREQLAALNNLNAISRDIIRALLRQSTREEVEALVCDRLADSDSYTFAWVGTVDEQCDEVVLQAEAGVTDYLDGVTIRVDDSEAAQGPTGQAFRTNELQVCRNVRTDPAYEQWRDRAEEYGYHASAAVPVSYENTVYGVLNVYTDRPDAFDTEERAVLQGLGDVMGHAMNAIERQRLLMSDEITEVEFRIRDLFDHLDFDGGTGTVTVAETIPTGEGEYLAYGSASEAGQEWLDSLVEAVPHWEDLQFVGSAGDGRRFELRLDDPPLLSLLGAHGGRVRTARITDGDYHITVELPPDASVRAVVDGVKEVYPGAEMLVQRRTSMDSRDGGHHGIDLGKLLTDRQQAAVEAAYHAGFFEWPRESTGEEVADALGISPPTFHQHLRTAEQHVLCALLDTDADTDDR